MSRFVFAFKSSLFPGPVRTYVASSVMKSAFAESAATVSSARESTYGFTRRAKDAWSDQDIADLPTELRPDHAETLDLILRKRIYLLQSRRGYRANTDSQTLSYFACLRLARSAAVASETPLRVLDLGAGNGLVSVLFARAFGPGTCRLWLLELQGQLVDRARRNLLLNDLQGVALRHDLADGLPPQLSCHMDVVLMNPPFYKMQSRSPPRRREKLLAHMETSADIDAFCAAASASLHPGTPHARVFIIYDIREVYRLYSALSAAGLDVKSVQKVQHRVGEKPTRILIEATLRKQTSDCEHSESGHIEDNDARMLPMLCLHPPGTNLYEYDPSMERFLNSLPQPNLRIGQLR